MKRILNLFLVLLMGLVLVGLGTKEVRAEEDFVLLYETGFESASRKTSYASDEITDGDFTWILSESLRGKESNDKKNGSWSIRGRSDGYARITNKFKDLLKIDFKFAHYGSLTNGELKLQVSNDSGETWQNVWIMPDEVFSNLTPIEVLINYDVLDGVNFGDELSVQWKFDGPSGNNSRMNIDDIKIYSGSLSLDIDGKVNQLIDDENTLSTTISAKYGQDINVEVTNTEENKFQFGLVNGVIRDDIVVGGNTLPITDDLEVSLVYAKENNNAVLFLDSNGKLIKHTWVMDGESVTAPNITELSKPGYEISDISWLSNEGGTSLEGINTSRVYTLQYELVETQVVITVNGTETTYDYNEVVTLESTSEEFKAWVDGDGNVLSTKPVYSFTALTNKTIVESTVAPATPPVVTMTNDLMLRDDHQTFVGQLELREGDTLVEYGLVVTKDGLLKNEELTLENGTKARTNVLNSLTNEFMMSISEEYLVTRAYVVVRNGNNELETFYSDNQYNDASIVTFDTNGGNEIDSVAVMNGSSILKPTDPVRSSHGFLGWFADEALTQKFNFSTSIDEDITIYAKWEEILPTISEVRELSVRTSTEFVGIVTGIDGKNLFVQDDTAAIYVYNASLPAGLKVGDEVRIQGSRAEFNGLQQIGSGATITIESSGNTLPNILVVTDITTLNADLQTQRITIENLTVKSQSGTDLTLTDGTNDILIHAASGTEIYTHIQNAEVGQKAIVHEAFVGWFNGLQLTVVNIEDLEFVEPTDEELAQIVLDEIVSEWSDKEFNMGTSVALPLQGDHDSTIVWEFTKQGETEVSEVVVDGKWIDVEIDTIYNVLVTVTLGEAELPEEFNITIKFVDGEVVEPITIIDIVTTDTSMASYNSSEFVFTHDEIQFGYLQFMNQAGYMQGKKNQGLFYNITNLGNIQKIVITLGSSQGTSMEMKGGSEQKPGTTINGTVSGMIHTFDFAGNQFDYFMLEAKSAIQISKIEIFYFPN